jgi:hypothetical protein
MSKEWQKKFRVATDCVNITAQPVGTQTHNYKERVAREFGV